MSGLYIAGPDCFFSNGYSLWWSKRKLAEYYGITVTMPTATELKQDAMDKRDNAKEIFDDLLMRADQTDVLIADLESFRGPEADGGTVFEMGMMYRRGARIYGYDIYMRPVIARNPYAIYQGDVVLDEKGFPYPYSSLPFAPSVMATTTLVHGGFEDALRRYLEDCRTTIPASQTEKKMKKRERRVFVSTYLRYGMDYEKYKERILQSMADKGFEAVFAEAPSSCSDMRVVCECVRRNLEKIDSSSYFLADLNDFRGYEPSADVAFESGYAFSAGLKCLGFMEDSRKMRDRIPNKDGLDAHGNIVENFDYPINLMFSCSMKIYEAEAEDAEKHVEALSSVL